jgi:serine/threonine protein kinase
MRAIRESPIAALFRERPAWTRTSKVLRAVLDHASPEVMNRRPLDGRVDVYALGMVQMERMSGHDPLDPSDVNLLAPEDTGGVPVREGRAAHARGAGPHGTQERAEGEAVKKHGARTRWASSPRGRGLAR